MKNILLLPLIFIVYIFYTIYCTFKFICELVKNIFEKKCIQGINEIVAITYYSEEWPELFYLTLYYDDKLLPNYYKMKDKNVKVSNKKFNLILDTIKENNILDSKKYILNYPFITYKEFYSYFTSCDAGIVTQKLTIYFKNGEYKEIIGYSKKMSNLRKKLEEVLPKEIFY